MLSRTFRALPVLFLLCSAGAALGRQHPEVCENKPPKDPAYYADMKGLPPGLLGISYLNERAQFDDPSVPVFLNAVGAISNPEPRALKLSCVEVRNRAPRAVRTVQLRWAVWEYDAEGRVPEGAGPRARGVLPPFPVEVAPGVGRKVEIRGVQFADFFLPLAGADGRVNGRFLVTFGVARAEFDDGTSVDLP